MDTSQEWPYKFCQDASEVGIKLKVIAKILSSNFRRDYNRYRLMLLYGETNM